MSRARPIGNKRTEKGAGGTKLFGAQVQYVNTCGFAAISRVEGHVRFRGTRGRRRVCGRLRSSLL